MSNDPPQADHATGTLKLRLDAENPDFALRPEILVEIELPAKSASLLTVPAEAVLDSGLRKTVFADLGGGVFEPRTVETGVQIGDRIEIRRGLEAGERVAAEGNFLLDSESRMRARH